MVTLPIAIISYDPVKQAVVRPKIINDVLDGYKGGDFLECGYIYAPYIPLHRTLTSNLFLTSSLKSVRLSDV